MRDHIKPVVFRPDAHKKLDITFGPTQAAALLGRTPEAIAKAEAKGRLPQPKQLGNGRRYYMIEDLIEIRAALGIQVGKQAHEDAVVVAVQNFKGGVGKSTITKHRSEEHTSELQSLMRISYAVFCLKKKNNTQT